MTKVDLNLWQMRARRDSDLSSSTKVLVAELAYHFRLGMVRLPQAHLMETLGWSRPTLVRAFQQAVEQGWLVRERPDPGECNHYRATLPARLS